MLGVDLGLAGEQPEFKRSRVDRGKSVEDLMRTFQKLFRIAGVLLALAGVSALTMIGPASKTAWTMIVVGVLIVVFAGLLVSYLYLPWLWLWARLGGFRLAFGLPRGYDYVSRQFTRGEVTDMLRDLAVEVNRISKDLFNLQCQLKGSYGVKKVEGFHSRRELLGQLRKTDRRWEQTYRRFAYRRDLAYAAGCFVFGYYGNYLDEQKLEQLPIVGRPDRRMVVMEYSSGESRLVATKAW